MVFNLVCKRLRFGEIVYKYVLNLGVCSTSGNGFGAVLV